MHRIRRQQQKCRKIAKESVSSDVAGIAQLVEHDLAKVGVASSSLVSRSKIFTQSKFNYPQPCHALYRAVHTMY